MLKDLNPWLSPIYIDGTTHVFRHVFKRMFLGLGIWDYFMKIEKVLQRTLTPK